MSHKKKEIMEKLKNDILSLELKPGTLISETSLSEKFNLSRTPIRDILKQLSLQGFIDIYPKKGNIVSYIDLESVEQITFLRSTLEKEIMKDLSSNIPITGLHNLMSILAMQNECIESKIENQDKLIRFMVLDDRFHKTLFELAGRKFLWNLIQQFNVHYMRYRKLHAFKKEKLRELLQGHQEILDCIVHGQKDRIDDLVYHHIRADINSPYFRENFMEYVKTPSKLV
ncbi:MAG: GntR family transcriptional regulator [Clostridiales bacterium]|nr:GntR family transcriptional regulator [Clostridiales bacterium]